MGALERRISAFFATFILSEGGNFFQHLYFVLVYNVFNNLSQYNNENVRKAKHLKAPKKIMVNASQVLFQTLFLLQFTLQYNFR